MIHWNVNPILVDFGPVQIRWYGVCFLVAFLIGHRIVTWMCEREGKPLEALDSLLTYIIVGTIVGARLGHVLFYDPKYYFDHLLEIPQVWKGGLASHGGTLGVIIAIWLFCRKHKEYPVAWVWDRICVPVPMVAGFIRIGNLMNSEIIGKPANVPWSFVFEKIDRVPRHPAQLYESLSYFTLFLINLTIYRRNPKSPPGLIFGLAMVWIFASRMVLEIFKENQEPFEAGMFMNMGQLLSIPFVLLGLYCMYRSRFWEKPKAA